MKEIDMEKLSENLLDDTELAALVSSLAQNNGKGETTDVELTDLLEWAQQIRLEPLLLDMAVRREIVITSIEGDPLFGLPHGKGKEKDESSTHRADGNGSDDQNALRRT